jgi:Ethanolamine utilization protein EutJ (predicted chaperonin)
MSLKDTPAKATTEVVISEGLAVKDSLDGPTGVKDIVDVGGSAGVSIVGDDAMVKARSGEI